MSLLVVIEHNQKALKPAALSTLAAAFQIAKMLKDKESSSSEISAKEINIVVVGYECESVIQQLQSIAGIKKIFFANDERYLHPLAEAVSPLIANIVKENNFTYLLAPATTFGKNILPRTAALLDVAQISDIIEVVDHVTYRRPIYAGNAIETVRSKDPICVITVRATAFASVSVGANENTTSLAEIIPVNLPVENTQSRFLKAEVHGAERPELTSADIVISGGRGLKDKATFEKLMLISERMKAAIGASRAAVDAGLAPNDFQVGQTGKIVAPKLYMAVGISGAIQHLAGMKDSKIIVAINKDPDAPIFQVADFGLIGNIEEILPSWEKWLDENGY